MLWQKQWRYNGLKVQLFRPQILARGLWNSTSISYFLLSADVFAFDKESGKEKEHCERTCQLTNAAWVVMRSARTSNNLQFSAHSNDQWEIVRLKQWQTIFSPSQGHEDNKYCDHCYLIVSYLSNWNGNYFTCHNSAIGSRLRSCY